MAAKKRAGYLVAHEDFLGVLSVEGAPSPASATSAARSKASDDVKTRIDQEPPAVLDLKLEDIDVDGKPVGYVGPSVVNATTLDTSSWWAHRPDEPLFVYIHHKTRDEAISSLGGKPEPVDVAVAVERVR